MFIEAQGLHDPVWIAQGSVLAVGEPSLSSEPRVRLVFLASGQCLAVLDTAENLSALLDPEMAYRGGSLPAKQPYRQTVVHWRK